MVIDLAIKLASNEIRHRARLVKVYNDVPLVTSDGVRLGQAFLNLLVNAAQAIPEGSADDNEIRIVTQTNANGDAVVVISDTGCGISPASDGAHL